MIQRLLPDLEPDRCEEGKPRVLRMEYLGASCESTTHAQDPKKVECEEHGGALPDSVFIVASDK